MLEEDYFGVVTNHYTHILRAERPELSIIVAAQAPIWDTHHPPRCGRRIISQLWIAPLRRYRD